MTPRGGNHDGRPPHGLSRLSPEKQEAEQSQPARASVLNIRNLRPRKTAPPWRPSMRAVGGDLRSGAPVEEATARSSNGGFAGAERPAPSRASPAGRPRRKRATQTGTAPGLPQRCRALPVSSLWAGIAHGFGRPPRRFVNTGPKASSKSATFNPSRPFRPSACNSQSISGDTRPLIGQRIVDDAGFRRRPACRPCPMAYSSSVGEVDEFFPSMGAAGQPAQHVFGGPHDGERKALERAVEGCGDHEGPPGLTMPAQTAARTGRRPATCSTTSMANTTSKTFAGAGEEPRPLWTR